MKKYQDLKDDQRNWLVASPFMAFMCGTQSAQQDRHGTVTLTFTDLATETAPLPEIQLLEDDMTIFEITGLVKRKLAPKP